MKARRWKYFADIQNTSIDVGLSAIRGKYFEI